MLLNENYKRVLNAFTADMLRNIRNTFIIVFSILAAMPVLNFISLTSSRVTNSRNIIVSSSGVLSIGFVTVLITLSIVFFASASNTEIFNRFVWPINRDIYAVGNLLTMLTYAVITISGVSVLLLLEIIPLEIVKSLFADIIIVTGITFENFIAGFWICICYVMLFSSFSYFLGMYFFRQKILTAVVFSLLLMLASSPFMRSLYNGIYLSIFQEQSVMTFSLKAWLLILMFHALAYIPLKRMEVRI